MSWAGVLGSIRYAAGRDLRWMALITSFTFVIWMDIAALMTFGFLSGEMTGFKDLLTQIFTTPSGLLFLAVGNLGALIALVVFSFSAVSFPMLYDRDVDFVTAMVSSIRLVLKNPVVMLSWGAIIGVLTVISILSAFLGLIVTLPVLGHATWTSIAAASRPRVRSRPRQEAPPTRSGDDATPHPARVTSAWNGPGLPAMRRQQFVNMEGESRPCPKPRARSASRPPP